MRIVPVIDLLHRQVVRGVGGRRHEYRPVESLLCRDARVQSVAAAFRRLQLDEVYVADLDAIAGGEPAWNLYAEIIAAGLRPWVDAGVQSLQQAEALASFHVHGASLAGVIAGLESLPGPRLLADLVKLAGESRLIFSLDLKHGKPLATIDAWREESPLEIARAARDAGARRIIVLDLARVGEGQGVGVESLCRSLRLLDATWELTAGGGVRDENDLLSLAESGCDAVLVASALHDGRVDPAAWRSRTAP